MKRISVEAYQALRDALPVVTWYKNRFESLVRTALRDQPELLVGLDFSESKRAVSDRLVARLSEDEKRYQALSLNLMGEIGRMTRFQDIENLKEPDRTERLGVARDAVGHLKSLLDQFSMLHEQDEAGRAQRESDMRAMLALRKFGDDLASLKSRFLSLQGAASPQQRGRDFERLLHDLFDLYDMEARLAYALAEEQIDGALTFDTDDYLVEAKWLAGVVDRAALDVFAAKVRRKGKNALGLFVSVNGFSGPALQCYDEATPFLCMDGDDLFLVLDARLRLDELLKAKRRHANETGSCFLPARGLL